MPSKTADQRAIAIVLAAGKGTRMKSELPKVLVPVIGRPMIRYVIDALHEAGIWRILVVVGYRGDLVRAELADQPGVEFVEQAEQLGTGHAVMMCRDRLADFQGPVFIVAGDSPLLQSISVKTLLENFSALGASCVLGTVEKPNPTGYGRIVRDEAGSFVNIVEEKDATSEQRDIKEVNVSTYVFDSSNLLWALDQLTDNNTQREYYITDCPAILMAKGKTVTAEKVLKACESLSINNMDELTLVEQEMKRLGKAS